MFKDRFFGVQQLMFSPDDALGTGPEVDEDLDDDNTPDEGDEEDEEGDKKKDKEDDEEDEEDDEDEESTLSRFTLEDLKSAFKDKPELYKEAKHAFFREQKFTEIFPTIEDANRAVEAQLAYEEITNSIVDGDAAKFVEELKKESSEGLEKFSKNFISTIFQTDKDLYLDLAEPIVKQFLKRVHDHGKTITDEKQRNQIIAAAKIVRKAIFSGDYEDINNDEDEGLINRDRSKGTDKDKDKEARDGQQYLALFKDVSNTCYSKLEEEIARGLKDLDKGKAGLKKILLKDIKATVLEEMDKDSGYTARMRGLWMREKRAGYNGALKSSLLTTFLGKAKVLIPKIRASARKEVLGKEDNQEKDTATRLVGNRESRNTSKKITPEMAKKENMSTLDVLSGGKKS